MGGGWLLRKNRAGQYENHKRHRFHFQSGNALCQAQYRHPAERFASLALHRKAPLQT